MIFIISEYEKAEKEYVSSSLSYAALSDKYGIPLSILAKHAKNNNWVEKRKRKRAEEPMPSLDVSKLARSSDALESIIESAFLSVSEAAESDKAIDTKTIKELAATLKEAINIKQNIFLLPVITAQKHLELEQKSTLSQDVSQNEITVILDDDTEKYCV